MADSTHTVCATGHCHDIFTGTQTSTSHWFGSFALLLVCALLSIIVGIVLLLAGAAARARPIPPGWYPDPSGVVGARCYWDGRRWTEHASV